MSKMSTIHMICYEEFDALLDADNVTAENVSKVKALAVEEIRRDYSYLTYDDAKSLVEGMWDLWVEDRAVRQ